MAGTLKEKGAVGKMREEGWPKKKEQEKWIAAPTNWSRGVRVYVQPVEETTKEEEIDGSVEGEKDKRDLSTFRDVDRLADEK